MLRRTVDTSPVVERTLYIPALRLQSDRKVRLHLSITKYLCIYAMCVTVSFLISQTYAMHMFNVYLSLIWVAYCPIAIIALIGGVHTRHLKTVAFRGTVQNMMVFMIPTVARTDTLGALKRAIDSILCCASRHLLHYEIHVVIDQGAEGIWELQKHYRTYPQVRFLFVPEDYKTVHDTQYKARANQYALEYRKARGINGPDVFIYHGDDDTSVGHDTIASIADFITNKSHRYDLAQGILTYPWQFSPSWICRFADSVRPADDLTRFLFFTGLLGSPLAGLHGEHLLIRASIEEFIGWDFGKHIRVEDAYFGLTFARMFPKRSTFLASCSYGASPERVSDLIKQRKRWTIGLLGLLCDKQVPFLTKLPLCYSVLLWATSFFSHFSVILTFAYLTGMVNTGPISPIFIFLWNLNFAYFLWMYLEGLRINLEVSNAPRWQYMVFPILQLLCFPVISFIEAWAALLGSKGFIMRERHFEVIRKSH